MRYFTLLMLEPVRCFVNFFSYFKKDDFSVIKCFVIDQTIVTRNREIFPFLVTMIRQSIFRCETSHMIAMTKD